jgi:hypothetical protein
MVVLARVPEAGTVMELVKPEVLMVETSKPLGAVTVIGAVMLVPEMVKLLVDEGVPKVVLRAVRLPETEMTGVEAVTVPVTAIFFDVAPVLLRVMLPV